MNIEMKEQLSALMDGEVDRDAARFVLRSTDSDTTLRAAWSRYHVARDVLRKQPVMLAADGFSASLMARLDAEDAVVVAGKRGGSIGRWARYASGGAVAAAVAVVALIASAPGTRQQPQSEALVARTAPVSSDPTPAVNVARAVNFTSDPILMPSPLVQPVSATRSLSGYGYDTRMQSPWRHDGIGAQRQGQSPYVYVIVPPGAGAAESQRPH